MVSFLSDAASQLYFDESIQPLFFLKPSNPADGPTRDSVIDGVLVFKVSRARDVKEITVELTGKQTMWVGSRHEAYDTLYRSLTLTPGWLEEGEHRFAWSMVVPANTAPFEACIFGRTGHTLKATAKGCGIFGKDLVAYGEVDLTSDPNDPGIAPGFDRSREIFHPVLGPLRGRFFTKYLLRGGYIRFALTMPALGQAVTIKDVQVIVVQNFNLQSMKNPQLVEHVSIDIPLWSLRKEGVAPLNLKEGGDLSLVRQIRLMAEGQHEAVRPTSNDWSETGIRIAHQILIVIRFQPLENNPDEDVKELKMPFEAKISSCASSVENLQLPDYETVSANVKSFRTSAQGWRMACLCHRPTSKELEAVYGSDLKADKEDEYGHEINRQLPWLLKMNQEATTP